MVKLFVCESVLPSAPHQYRVKNAPYDKFLQAIGEFREVYESLLVRTVFDNNKNHFGGLEAFLASCVSNGHDRTDQNNWGQGFSQNIIAGFKKEGYKANDVIWAEEWQRESKQLPFSLNMLTVGGSATIFVIDAVAYVRQNSLVHVQKDVAKRQRSLLAIVLFDAALHPSLRNTRSTLQFDIDSPSATNLPQALSRIHAAGYFLK